MPKIGFKLSAVVTCVVLSITYSLLIYGGATEWTEGGENMWVDNVAAAERFLFSEDEWDIAFVGSSLTGRLPVESIEGRVYNLAFGGMSTLDGLQVISQAANSPCVVFIETNLLHRDEDVEFTSQFLSPVIREPRRVLPMLRDSYRPLVDLSWGAFYSVRYSIKSLLGKGGQLAPAEDDGRDDSPSADLFEVENREASPSISQNNELFETMLSREVEEHSVRLSETELNRIRRKLIKLTNGLRERGTTVVFFETPVNWRVSESPAYAQNRALTTASLAFSSDRRMPIPDSKRYDTIDGVHLTEGSAQAFVETIEAEIRQWKLLPGCVSNR